MAEEFEPIAVQVRALPTFNKQISAVAGTFLAQCTHKGTLEALKLQSHKPVPLPLLTPFVEDDFHAKKSDPDKAKKDSRASHRVATVD